MIAGCDEVGRGCLAGPVTAAAVILDEDLKIDIKLTDSKKMSAKEREAAKEYIIENCIDYGIASVESHEIDVMNISNASIIAMHRALEKLKERPSLILVDGAIFIPYRNIPYECIIKGDMKEASISAASVLAKVERDRIMTELHESYAHYGWNTNVGYPTKKHYSAIREHGITKHHRKTFNLFK